MYCKYCGNRLLENSNFCTFCGKVTDDTVDENKKNEYSENIVDPFSDDKDSRGGSILTFGVLALSFALTFWLSPLGLIFAIISRVKVGSYEAMYGQTNGRATVGGHLARAGLIVSIVFSALLVVCLFLAVFSTALMFIE